MQEFIDQIKLYDEVILISSTRIRQTIQEFIFNQKLLLNVKYKTFSEVVGDWYGFYSKEALVRIVQEEDLNPEIAQILLDNTFYVSNESYNNTKLNDLTRIKNKYKPFLIKDNLMINLYKYKKIFVINPDYNNNLFINLLSHLKSISNIEIISVDKKIEKDFTVYHFDSIKDEVEALAIEISRLLSSGINPQNIKIHTLDNNYLTVFKEVFEFFNIDVDFETASVLFEFPIARIFLDILKEQQNNDPILALNNSLEVITNTYQANNEQFEIILNSMIKTINEYTSFDCSVRDLVMFLEYEFKNTYIKTNKYDNVIKLSNLFDEYITPDDYVFILGFNQDILPKIARDEDYLLDSEKELLGFKTSRYINKKTKENLLRVINTSKNIYLSYALNSLDGKLSRSNFIDFLKNFYQVDEMYYQNETNISFSKSRAKFNLAKMLDEYYRYDVKSDKLFSLYQNLADINYLSYQNGFTSIDETYLKKYLENDFRLSFTAIDSFYNCSFKFYLERILKINLSSNQRALMIGNYFHYVLEQLMINNLEAEEIILDEITESFISQFSITLSSKDRLYFNIFKDHIKRIYKIIKEQFERSSFKLHSLEETYEVKLNYNFNPLLSGKIDKVLTYEINNQQYAIVIDYKTGNNEFNYNNSIYGLDLQTLIYFYLLNNSQNKNYLFAGAYLQSLFPSNPFLYDSKKTYGEQLRDYLKWNGYTIKDFSVIEHIDPFFNNDGFLKGIKQKKDLDFHANSLNKVLTKEEFEKLQEVLKNKITDCVELITEGDFKINPKKSSNLDSCKYCLYQDICFRKESDYVRLNTFKNLEFIRNGVDNNDSK